MDNFRTYGKPPFSIILIHGGPGAIGEMAPVAERIGERFGILELLNRGLSISEQLEELNSCIEMCPNGNPVLVGFSWGAWLSIIFAAIYQGKIKKLIVIGCGPLEDHYSNTIFETRISRLDQEQRKEFLDLLEGIENSSTIDRNQVFGNLGKLVSKSDCFDAIENSDHTTEIDANVYIKVWNEASALRKQGILMNDLSNIKCPVIVIHGDYDPHPKEGILQPLKQMQCNYRVKILKKCGHKPWIEKFAREAFFKTLFRHLE